MSMLVTAHQIRKTMGSKLLFDDLSFGVGENERVGLLGPNGAGKSTLLKILSGDEPPDSGEVSWPRGIRVAYVEQDENFSDGQSALSVAQKRLEEFGLDSLDAQVQASVSMGIAGFTDLEQNVGKLSGGWRKRLSLAIAFAKEPDLLLLDEPTNHMDWDGILWLESWLSQFKKSFLLVSHDRVFLQRLCNKTMEINRLYRDGYLSFDCSYEKFLERKEEYIQAQLSLQDSLENKARREMEWARAGVKARTTKSQSRLNEAYNLVDTLNLLKSRNRSGQRKVQVEIDSTGRRSKKMIELKNFTVAYGEKVLLKDLQLLLGPGSCLGLLGSNGSGKTSLLKAIAGGEKNFTGERFIAEGLQIVYFDQKRETLPGEQKISEFLGDGSDHVVFKNQSLHVAAYASRFLFSSEKLNLKIAQLSGGEQARLLIAKLLLQPADVLILDEPTNDLDIESIEILEASLSSFDGLALVVSHDRKFLSNLCDRLIALDGKGGWSTYADLDQWLKAQRGQSEANEVVVAPEKKPQPKKKVKLSYKEKRQLESMEADLEKAEADLAEAVADLEDPKIVADHEKLQMITEKVQSRQKTVDDLYELWSQLEAKQNQLEK